MRDNFYINFDLLADSDDEDEPFEVTMQHSEKAQSACGRASLKGSAGDASTSAAFSDDGTTSSAGSDRATSNPTTPVPTEKCVKMASGAFSDDDEPACEPTPSSSRASLPKAKNE